MNEYFVDDITLTKPKRKNSGDKGRRTERNLAKLLSCRFKVDFSRSVGSGNRWGQVQSLPKHAQDTYAGDLVVPENFKFVLECKGGYDDVDLQSIFEGGNAQLDEFLEQCDHESKDCGRKSLLMWKKDRKDWLAFIKTADLPHLNWSYRLIYREWSVVSLKLLLQEDDAFFYL